jgi:hypothetical protein
VLAARRVENGLRPVQVLPLQLLLPWRVRELSRLPPLGAGALLPPPLLLLLLRALPALRHHHTALQDGEDGACARIVPALQATQPVHAAIAAGTRIERLRGGGGVDRPSE